MNEKQKKIAIISGGIIAPILASSILAIGFLGASKTPENEELYLDNLREVNEEISFEYGDYLDDETILVTNKNQEQKEIQTSELKPAINIFEVGRTQHTAVVDGEEYFVDVLIEDTKYPKFEESQNSFSLVGHNMTEEEIKEEMKGILVAHDEVDGQLPISIELKKKTLNSYDAVAKATDYNGNVAKKEFRVVAIEDREKVQEEEKNMTKEQIEEKEAAKREEAFKLRQENKNNKKNQGDTLEDNDLSNDPTPAEKPQDAPMPGENAPAPTENPGVQTPPTQTSGLGLLTEITADQDSPFSLDFSKIPTDVRNVKSSPIPWATLQKANLGNVIYNLDLPISKDNKVVELIYTSNKTAYVTIKGAQGKAFLVHNVDQDTFGFFNGEKAKYTEDEMYELRYIARLASHYHSKMYFPKVNEF